MKTLILWLFILATCEAQRPTTPQIQGYTSGRTLNGLPLTLTGVPYAKMPGSVWRPDAQMVAEHYMTYKVQGDHVLYANKTIKTTELRKDGSWEISGLDVKPHPEHLAGGKYLVAEQTSYSLFIYQRMGSKESFRWNAEVKGMNTLAYSPAPKIPPVKVRPIDKRILNPQPIPPKTNKG
jgi:hypothetical protein